MRLNIELSPDDLEKWDEKTMRFTDREMSANALLNTIDKNFEDFRHHKSTSLVINGNIYFTNHRIIFFWSKYIQHCCPYSVE